MRFGGFCDGRRYQSEDCGVAQQCCVPQTKITAPPSFSPQKARRIGQHRPLCEMEEEIGRVDDEPQHGVLIFRRPVQKGLPLPTCGRPLHCSGPHGTEQRTRGSQAGGKGRRGRDIARPGRPRRPKRHPIRYRRQAPDRPSGLRRPCRCGCGSLLRGGCRLRHSHAGNSSNSRDPGRCGCCHS